jgi:hypothetical protein
MSSRTTPTTPELAEEASAWAAGAGIVTMALFPLALPVILLTAIAAIPLLLVAVAVGLVVAVVAAPILLLRRPRRVRFLTTWRPAEPRPRTYLQLARRSSRRTVTASPASFPIALRTSPLTGSLWVPSPSAMNELRKGWPSTVPRTFTRPRVPKKSTESRITT